MPMKTVLYIIGNIITYLIGIMLITLGVIKLNDAKDTYNGQTNRLSILTISKANNNCIYEYTFNINNNSIIFDGTYSNSCDSGDILILTPYYNIVHYKKITPTSNYIGTTPTHDISTTIATVILSFGAFILFIGITTTIYLIMRKNNQIIDNNKLPISQPHPVSVPMPLEFIKIFP